MCKILHAKVVHIKLAKQYHERMYVKERTQQKDWKNRMINITLMEMGTLEKY